jgi:hypothetical protein
MNGGTERRRVWRLLGILGAALLATPHGVAGADPCPLSPAAIDEIRARAEARCAQRGMTCETGVLDYVRCVNAAVAAGVARGRMPRECRRTAEVSPAQCAQPRPMDGRTD